jgi:serine/threonine protein kinase
MGIVYLAEDTTLDRMVALKVLHPFLTGDDEFLRRFENEAKSVAKLLHPHVVPINSFNVIDGRLVIEMPYFEGGSLGALFRSRGVFRVELLRFAGDILDALRYCHREGIVHRDVKPMNVLLDKDGRAFLSDFGLAKVAEQQRNQAMSGLTSTGVFLGTPRYAPPETWEGAQASPAWDMYSVGVILYEGLSGRPLYKSETPLAYLKELAETDVTPLSDACPDASEALVALVGELVEKNPDVRLASAEEALERLRQSPEWDSADEKDTPTSVIRLDLPGRPKAPLPVRLKHLGRRAGPWTGWVLALVLAILAAVWLLGSPATAPTPPATLAGEAESPGELVVPAHVLPDLSAMMSLPRFPSPNEASVYETHSADSVTEKQSQWLLRRNGRGEPVAALGMESHRLLALAVEETPQGGLVFSGRWGAFTDGTAAQAWHGTVEGRGHWLQPDHAFSATLSFVSEEHTARWEEHMSAGRVDEGATEFLYRFEEADMLLPMVCNELMPRHEYWRAALPAWLPSFAEAVCRPAVLAGEDTVRVDGVASEETWLRGDAEGTQEVVAGWPRAASPEMRVRTSDKGLYVLLQAESAEAVASTTLDLLTDYRVPAGESTRYSVAFAGGQIEKANVLEGDETRPWASGWAIAESNASGRWYCEVFIPFEGLRMTAAPPPGALWRLNARCSKASDNDAAGPSLLWGAPEGSDVLHGVLLLFGDHLP